MFMACKYFKEQFNFNFTNVILPNLYGPGDDFNPVSSHVIPSLIFKIYNSKKINLQKLMFGEMEVI